MNSPCSCCPRALQEQTGEQKELYLFFTLECFECFLLEKAADEPTVGVLSFSERCRRADSFLFCFLFGCMFGSHVRNREQKRVRCMLIDGRR